MPLTLTCAACTTTPLSSDHDARFEPALELAHYLTVVPATRLEDPDRRDVGERLCNLLVFGPEQFGNGREEIEGADHLGAQSHRAARTPTGSRRRGRGARSAATARRLHRSDWCAPRCPVRHALKQGPSSCCSSKSSMRRIRSLEDANIVK